ncbi:hypothetical protein KC345_g90 [Hortaea werneckii]|nr:hypothetical protein KC345_g90 [Hortaea werneckii]
MAKSSRAPVDDLLAPENCTGGENACLGELCGQRTSTIALDPHSHAMLAVPRSYSSKRSYFVFNDLRDT